MMQTVEYPILDSVSGVEDGFDRARFIAESQYSAVLKQIEEVDPRLDPRLVEAALASSLRVPTMQELVDVVLASETKKVTTCFAHLETANGDQFALRPGPSVPAQRRLETLVAETTAPVMMAAGITTKWLKRTLAKYKKLEAISEHQQSEHAHINTNYSKQLADWGRNVPPPIKCPPVCLGKLTRGVVGPYAENRLTKGVLVILMTAPHEILGATMPQIMA